MAENLIIYALGVVICFLALQFIKYKSGATGGDKRMEAAASLLSWVSVLFLISIALSILMDGDDED